MITPARRRILIGLAIVLLFLLLSMFFTRPLLTRGHDAVIANPYDSMLQAWTLDWDLHELSRNPLNLFNANIFFPNRYTLAYTDHQIVNAVLAAPLMALTHNPIQSANLLLIFQFLLCSLGAYFLVAHLTRNRLAGVIAGIAYAYAPYKIAHLSHLNLSSAAWIPLSILFLHLYCEKKRSRDAVLFALFFTLQTLTAWHYGLMLALGILIFLLVRFIVSRKTFSLRWTLRLVAVLACAMLVVLPFALPYFKLNREVPEFQRGIGEVEFYSADVQDFFLAPNENLIWGEATSGLREDAVERGNPTERAVFPGLIPLILAIVGVVYLFRKRKQDEEQRFSFWYYLSLGIFSAIMCLGPTLYFFGHRVKIPLPYRVLYYLVPGFKGMRVPARFAILTALALAVLSGFAVKGLMDWLRSRRKAAAPAIASLLLIAILLVDLMTVFLPMYRVPTKEEFPAVYYWLEDRKGEAPTVELPLAEYDPTTFYKIDEGGFIALESYRTYYSTAHWKKTLNGFSGFIPASYTDAVRACRDFPSEECMDFFEDMGIEFMIVHGEQMEPELVGEMEEWDREHEDVELVEELDSDYVYRFTWDK